MQHYNELIQKFHLSQHPEGGYYRRVYESSSRVTHSTNGSRAALSAIYYLLHGNDFSAFHQLDADEIWHYYQGTVSLKLHLIDTEGNYEVKLLGPEHACYQAVMPANHWFAAELMSKADNDYGFFGCCVAPGFEFERFQLANRQALIQQYPAHAELVTRFTR